MNDRFERCRRTLRRLLVAGLCGVVALLLGQVPVAAGAVGEAGIDRSEGGAVGVVPAPPGRADRAAAERELAVELDRDAGPLLARIPVHRVGGAEDVASVAYDLYVLDMSGWNDGRSTSDIPMHLVGSGAVDLGSDHLDVYLAHDAMDRFEGFAAAPQRFDFMVNLTGDDIAGVYGFERTMTARDASGRGAGQGGWSEAPGGHDDEASDPDPDPISRSHSVEHFESGARHGLVAYLPSDADGDAGGEVRRASQNPPSSPCSRASSIFDAWVYDGWYNRNNRIASAITANRTTVRYDYFDTSETQVRRVVEIAWSGVGGSLQGYSSIEGSAGATFIQGSNLARELRIEIRIHRYKARCYDIMQGTLYMSNTFDHRPAFWTGGASWGPNQEGNWTCKSSNWITTQATEFWVSRNKTRTYSAGLTIGIAGINVGSRQTYRETRSAKVTFVRNSGFTVFGLCGNNGTPTQATYVREMPSIAAK